ncbi:hypothetical protein [Streptomyces goshikiensis]|uniref:hypothetical protein n=1 Tax=Streptomyces goshikiensis TaxID=1942 RepID=UPI00367A063C
MRTLRSTYERVTPDLDEEERDVLVNLARAGTRHRETYAVSAYGQRDAEIELRVYTDGDGRERWAVIHDGPEFSEVSDTGDRAEANAFYEAEVEGLAGCAGDDDAPWWAYSDVSGVRHAIYTLLVEHQQDDGEWTDQEAEQYLGCVPTLPLSASDSCLPTTLKGAVLAIVAEALREQADTNYGVALHEAVGLPSPGRSARAVRATVTGTGTDGEETHTEERQVPETVLTELDIENYRRNPREMREMREMRAEQQAKAKEAAFRAEYGY